jgi:hypothetical protein
MRIKYGKIYLINQRGRMIVEIKLNKQIKMKRKVLKLYLIINKKIGDFQIKILKTKILKAVLKSKDKAKVV